MMTSGADDPNTPAVGRSPARLITTAVDQAMSSASNFVLVFLLARGSTPSDFGLVLIGYAILTVAVAVCRNAFGAILGMDLPGVSRGDGKVLEAYSLTGVVVCALPASIALVLYSSALPASGEASTILLVLALVAPVVALQDLHRYWAVAVARPGVALIADSLWVVIALAGFLAPLVLERPVTAFEGASIWAAGAGLSLLTFPLLGFSTRPAFSGLLPWLRSDPRRVRLGADAVLASLAPLGNASAVAAMAGPSVTAAVRGAGTLFGPINVLSATIPLAVVPEALRAPHRARRLFTLTAIGFGGLAVLWAGLLAWVPSSVGNELLGPTWDAAQHIILITGAEYVGLGFWAAAIAQMRAASQVGRALRFRLGFAFCSVAAPVIAVALTPTPTAFAGALAANSLVFGIWAFTATRKSFA